MTIDEALQILDIKEDDVSLLVIQFAQLIRASKTIADLFKQQQAERDIPQPLTLEQLKQRVGKPVWLETGEVTIGEQIIGRWVICKNIKEDNFYVDDYSYSYMRLYNYSETWLTYDYEPKEN